MKGKWHINSKGVAALCRATKRPCPFGAHYISEEKATEAANDMMESQYQWLPSNSKPKLSDEDRTEMLRFIKLVTGRTSAGFDYECSTTLALAEEMGFDYVAVSTEEYGVVSSNVDKEMESVVDGKDNVKVCSERLAKHYRQRGFTVANPNKLVNVVYYNEDPEDGMLVQCGGSNVLDAAIVKPGSNDIIEIKDLEVGAQYPVAQLDINKNGSIDIEALQNNNKINDSKITSQLSKLSLQDADGTNIKLDFGNVKDNQRVPLAHLVDSYKQKGATSFVYTTDSNTIHKVDLSKPTDEVVDELVDRNVIGTLRMRANNSQTKLTDGDLHRFNNLFHSDLFKSGVDSTKKYFTLSEIQEDKIERSGSSVRIGRYVLPVDYDSYKDKMDDKIIKRDIKSFNLQLTGDVRVFTRENEIDKVS